ncbi:MAG TPA: alpha/beta hydrolase domain-containing protein [Myxococcales bacterium]|nr:alpha/beta hydrolase domain-containing protein [Myxococcales bacterium]
MLVPRAAQARLTKFVIDKSRSESPTFGGHFFAGVGPYEKIVGTGFGEVNPSDPKNSLMVDIQLAPRNVNGNVEYAFDFYILKPMNLRAGAHKVMYEPPNRGNKTWATLGRFPGGNDPGSVTDPAILDNAFFMPRGYTIVFSGWDQAAGTSNASFVTTIDLTKAVAHNPDGSTVTGPGYEYIVTGGGTFTLTYAAASVDKSKATLTHRVHLDDVPKALGSSQWDFTNSNGTAIKLNASADAACNTATPPACTFIANDIYELMYTAKNPTVNTIGLAAIRDFNAWLRYETADGAGNANPLAGDVRRIYTEVVSQPGRTLNDFTHLGFNQAENGKIVFDGMLQWIAAGNGLSMNFRFSQPGRTERNRQEHLFNEATFPFANVMTTDPFTGNRDSRFARCEMSHTCPVAMEIYSANEYWVKTASLLHTTPDGKKDLPDSPFARNYFISSHQHGTGNATSKGNCQQFLNPLNSAPVQRALWIAMDEWVTEHRAPPPSSVPTLRDHTLVPPTQSAVGFPDIPGVTYTGLKTTRYRFNWGPGFYQSGIPTFNPPLVSPPMQDNPANGPIYPSFVPTTDRDGNDIAGIRLADVTVPVATYTGWALRAGAQANDGCESSGQFIPFPQTKAARQATGDPRRSSEERYGTLNRYVHEVAHALRKMVDGRLLLCEDYDAELSRLTTLGATTGGLQMDKSGAPRKPPPPHSCREQDEHDHDD